MSSKSDLIFQGQTYSRHSSGYHIGDAIRHYVAGWFVPAAPFSTPFPAHQTTQRNFREYLNLTALYLTVCVRCPAVSYIRYAIDSVPDWPVVVFGMDQDGQVGAILNWEVIFERTRMGVVWRAICQRAWFVWLFYRTRKPISKQG